MQLKFCRGPLKSIFSHSKKILLVINEDNILCLYRLAGMKLVWSVQLGEAIINKMILCPNANFVGLLGQQSTIEIRNIEDGSLATSIHWSPCTDIKWISCCNQSTLLCLWNNFGQLKLLLDAQTEIFSGFVAEEIVDVSLPENLTHITVLLKQRGLWSIVSFSTGINGYRLPRILAREQKNRTQRQHSESWSHLFSSLANLHTEHVKLIDDLQTSSTTNLEALIQQSVLLEDRNCLAGFRKLYDIRKIYRIRDKLTSLLDEVRRKLLAVQEDQQCHGQLEPIIISLKQLVMELDEAQKTFLSWICAICASVNSALPPVKLSHLMDAYSFLRKDSAKEFEAYYHQLTGTKPESKIALNFVLSHSKSIQLPPEVELVAMHSHNSNEIILISWNNASSCLQSHSILFDDEITTTTVLNTHLDGIAKPNEIHFCNSQGTLVALLYRDEMLIYIAKTLQPAHRIPWENQGFDRWKGVSLAQYALST